MIKRLVLTSGLVLSTTPAFATPVSTEVQNSIPEVSHTLPQPVSAQSLEQIQAQLQQLAAQVQVLSKAVEDQSRVIKQQEAELAAQKKTSAAGIVGDVKVSMKPSLKVESTDGKYSFQPFGRVHLDATAFDDDAFDHPTNANFRRARLGVKGNMGENLEYKSEFEFGEEAVNFKEVTLTYTGFDVADLKIGHQKPVFGMEQNTSSNYTMFIERSAPTNAFTRDEEIGINILLGGGKNWTFGGGVFNEDAGNVVDEDEDWTADVRGSVNLLGLMNSESRNVVHLGTGYSYRKPTRTARFNAAPAGEGPALIDTGAIADVDDVRVYNAELAVILGPVTFQGEYFNADVTRDNGASNINFDGYHAQVGWLLTGEQRPYKKGSFDRIKPKAGIGHSSSQTRPETAVNNNGWGGYKAGGGTAPVVKARPLTVVDNGWGAFELLARYENADLNDLSAGITGGALSNVTVGMNWYLTDHLRFMANVTDVNTDENAATAANDDPVIYNFRAQWDF